jgi:hypothetical protein
VETTLKFRTSSLSLSKAWLIITAAVLASGITYATVCLEISRVREEKLAALDAQAHFAVVAVDSKIEVELQQLRDLISSDRLKHRQFEEFYKEASFFAQRTRRQVVLHDVARNTQIFNTAYPLNANLQEGARFSQKSVIDGLKPDRPFISNVFYAKLAQKNLIAVAIPISEDGRVLYLLGVVLDPIEVLAAVKDGTYVKDTVTTVVDRNGIVLARSVDNDKYAGRKAPSIVAARSEKSGRFKGKNLDGVPIDIFYLQSELTGWAAVSFVQDRSDLRWPLTAALLAGLVVTLLGLASSILLNASRRSSSGTGEP